METPATGEDDSSRKKTSPPQEDVPVEREPIAPSVDRSKRKKKLLMGVIGALVLAAAAAFGIPFIRQTLNTVSTDDAYVNGHVTFVAPRVGGQISRVLVDDNNRVRKGELIADLDKEPYQVAVSEKKAAVDTATADLQAAIAKVRGIEAQARSQRWNLQHAVQEVDNQIALSARSGRRTRKKQGRRWRWLNLNLIGQRIWSQKVSCPVKSIDQRQAELTSANAGVVQVPGGSLPGSRLSGASGRARQRRGSWPRSARPG